MQQNFYNITVGTCAFLLCATKIFLEEGNLNYHHDIAANAKYTMARVRCSLTNTKQRSRQKLILLG